MHSHLSLAARSHGGGKSGWEALAPTEMGKGGEGGEGGKGQEAASVALTGDSRLIFGILGSFSFFLSFFFFFFFCLFCYFLGCCHGIWRFAGQGSNWSCRRGPTPEPQQRRIRAASATYITAQGNAGSLTH